MNSVDLSIFLMSKGDGVFYIGHASALVRINEKLLLFDPIWDHEPYGKYWMFHPQQINCDSLLAKVDAVFISHIHEDHICEPILRKIKCPVHVMWGRKNLTNRLRSYGCNVMEWQPHLWQYAAPENLDDGPDYSFYFVPHAFNSIDSSVFVRYENYCVYVGSDNFLDRKLLKQVAHDMTGIKLNAAMVPYAFIHWYPRLLKMDEKEMWQEVLRLNRQSITQAKDFIRSFHPEVVIPFGNNLMYADRYSVLNRGIANAKDLVEDPVETGDFVVGKEHYKSQKKEGFHGRELDPIDTNVSVEPEWLQGIAGRLSGVPLFKYKHELIVNSVVIDLHKMEIFIRNEDGEADCTRFDFDKEVFNLWAKGEITFEQAIGTRRFICRREPNKYNLEVFEFMNNYL